MLRSLTRLGLRASALHATWHTAHLQLPNALGTMCRSPYARTVALRPLAALGPQTLRTYATESKDAVPKVTAEHIGGEKGAEEPPPSGDELPKEGFRAKMRRLTKQYGWWSVGIYVTLGCIDCGATFALIHIYGGEKAIELEHMVRKWLHLNPKSEQTNVMGSPDANQTERPLVSGEESPKGELMGQLATEFVLAYGIHKTLLLPVRAAATVAITPTIVKWLIRKGWARPIASEVAAAAGMHAAVGSAKT